MSLLKNRKITTNMKSFYKKINTYCLGIGLNIFTVNALSAVQSSMDLKNLHPIEQEQVLTSQKRSLDLKQESFQSNLGQIVFSSNENKNVNNNTQLFKTMNPKRFVLSLGNDLNKTEKTNFDFIVVDLFTKSKLIDFNKDEFMSMIFVDKKDNSYKLTIYNESCDKENGLLKNNSSRKAVLTYSQNGDKKEDKGCFFNEL